MLFNSYFFLLVFLPSAILLFFLLGARSQSLAASFLALASLFFYSWWDIRFLPVLVCSIAWNYTCSGAIHALRLRRLEHAARATLALAIICNLALLGYFKYTGFFAKVLDDTLGTTLGPVSIVLPLGISFFTFTQIAFLVDVRRGEVSDFNIVRYILFVTYFPHLIAGPILHHKEMMPQFALRQSYIFDARNFAVGLAY